MNIEQLLPWLKTFPSSSTPTSPSSSLSEPQSPIKPHHKTYTCQRCLNHNLTVARKNHKFKCPFAKCCCEKCQLVAKRRQLNAELAQVKAMEASIPTFSPSVNGNCSTNIDYNKERLPHCQRCAQHNVQNRLKGHKRFCPFRACNCAKCKVVIERQRLMADQIKLRRRQKKQKSINSFVKMESPVTPPTSSTMASTPTSLSSHELIAVLNNDNHKIFQQNNSESQTQLQLPNLQKPFTPSFPVLPYPWPAIDWRFAFAWCALRNQITCQQGYDKSSASSDSS